ncbi:MAG: hypothetical protein AAGF71_08730 [Pseudomonadota bacterium]
MTDQQVDGLLTDSEVLYYTTGDTVLSPHAPPQVYSFLIEGRWWMQRKIAGADPVEWTDDRPGNWHGGVSLIDAVAPALVTAETDCTVLHVPRDVLDRLVAENAHLGSPCSVGCAVGPRCCINRPLANRTSPLLESLAPKQKRPPPSSDLIVRCDHTTSGCTECRT